MESSCIVAPCIQSLETWKRAEGKDVSMYRWDVSMYRCTFVARTYRFRELTAAAGAGADTRSGPVSYALIIIMRSKLKYITITYKQKQLQSESS